MMLSIMDQIGEMMAGQTMEINSAMSSMGEMMNRLVASEIAGKATEASFAQVDIAGYNYAACRYEQDGKE